MSDVVIMYMLVMHALMSIILAVAVINLRSQVRRLTDIVTFQHPDQSH